MSRRPRGFTLIEILVAISLLAMLGVLGYRGLEATTRSAQHIEDNAGRWQEIALALRRLGNDVHQALLVPLQPGSGWHQPAGGSELTFNSAGDEGARLRRLTYRLHEGRLELLVWPDINADKATRSYTLLNDVSAFELASLDHSNRWLASWPPAHDDLLPRALRLRITLKEGRSIERIFDVAAAR